MSAQVDVLAVMGKAEALLMGCPDDEVAEDAALDLHSARAAVAALIAERDALRDKVEAQPEAARYPSYDALLLIVQSVAGALERAGLTDCDDPGEAIDVIRERLERRIAELEIAPQQPAPVDLEAAGWIHEDELPGSYPYDAMFPFSKVDGVRMFPVYMPTIQPAPAIIDNAGKVECAEPSVEIIGWRNDTTPRLRFFTKIHNLPAGTRLYTAHHQPAPVVDDAMVRRIEGLARRWDESANNDKNDDRRSAKRKCASDLLTLTAALARAQGVQS